MPGSSKLRRGPAANALAVDALRLEDAFDQFGWADERQQTGAQGVTESRACGKTTGYSMHARFLINEQHCDLGLMVGAKLSGLEEKRQRG